MDKVNLMNSTNVNVPYVFQDDATTKKTPTFSPKVN